MAEYVLNQKREITSSKNGKRRPRNLMCFIFMIRLLIVPVSLLCVLPQLVLVKTLPDGYLVGKELGFLLFECVV